MLQEEGSRLRVSHSVKQGESVGGFLLHSEDTLILHLAQPVGALESYNAEMGLIHCC
jgi:hypothetical protein